MINFQGVSSLLKQVFAGAKPRPKPFWLSFGDLPLELSLLGFSGYSNSRLA